MKLRILIVALTGYAGFLFAQTASPSDFYNERVLEILLCAALLLVVFLAAKIRRLQNERDGTLDKNEADSKILFLKSRYASMGETVGNIAHQWKQPLNAIGSIQNSIKASLIFQGDISKEKLLDSVETSFKLLQHLADTIDTFYRFLAHQNNDDATFVISDEFEAIRKITEYSFENSRISLGFVLDANPTIRGDANEFTHAMLNLILNAKDALDDAHTDSPAITVRVSGGEENCTIIVADNAGGIRMEPIERIFDLHVTSKEEGSGLGLFMTKNIIEKRFGGTISVENKEGGACFTITLPYTEYGEYFSFLKPSDDTTSLKQIKQLTQKIIELEELEKTLKKWADIFKQAHWGIAMHVGKSNTFELTNAAFNALYGYTADELKNLSVPNLFTSESLSLLPKIQQEAFEKGYVAFESIHKRRDGSTFPVSVELIVVKDDNGEILYHIANIWDLTEKKAAEERLLLKKFALDHIKDAVFLIDENARFQYVNDGACTALGYSRDEFEHMSVGDVDPDWPQERWPEHWNVLKEVGSMTMELRHRRRDGTIFPVEISANYLEFGDKAYNMAIARDITERLRLEEQKDNERLRLFFERQLVGMAITSPEKGWLHTNEKLQEMLGYTHEELRALTWTEMTYPDDLAPDIEQFEKLLSGEIEDYMLEKRFIRKDGTIVYTNLAVSCVRNDDRSVNYVLALLEDITERKAAQEALAAKEREFRSLAENIPDNIARWDTEGNYLYINPIHEQTLGRSVSEAVGNHIPEGHSAVKEAIAHVCKTGEAVLVHQEVPSKDGEMEYHDVNIVPERDTSGKIISVLGVGRDMTDIYRLQNELEKREKELRSLADSSPGMMGTFYMRPDGSIYMPYVSPNISDIFGLKPQEVAEDATILMALTHPDDAGRLAESIAESARTMSIWHEEYRIIHPLKGERWMESNTKPELHPNGDIVWYGYVHDITERKELEALLEKERKFLIDAQRVAHTGSWYLDIQQGLLTWSDETYRIFELNKEDVDDLHTTFYERVHPEDREAVNAPYLESLNTRLPYEIEHRIVMDDGRIKYVIERCEHIYDPSGTPLYSIGTVQEITERKRMEIQLEDSHNFLNKVIDSIPDPIFVKDREHRWVMLNEAFCTLIDRPRFVLLGQSDYDFFPKEEADVFWEKDEDVFQSRDINVNEEPFTSADGTIHYIQTVKSVFVSTDGEEHLVGVIRDITERRNTENALQSNRNLLHAILESSPGVITYALDKNYRYIAFDSKHAYVMRTIFGKEIALGMDMFEAIGTNADREIAKRSFDRALSGESFTAEEEYGDERLSRNHWQIFYAPIYSEGGEIMGLTCFNIDITERKASEEAIKHLNETLEKRIYERTSQLQEAVTTLHHEIAERIEAEKQLRMVDSAVNSTTEAIYISDANLSILYVNDGACRMLGYTREELTSMKLVDLDATFSEDQIVDMHENNVSIGQTFFETKHRTKSGAIIDVEIVGNPFVYEGIEAAISVVKEISERKKIEVLQKERLALEERLSKVAATVPGVNYIFEKTVEGLVRFTYLAPTFEELFGLSSDAAMDDFSVVMERIHPDDREAVRQSIVDTARDFTNWHEEFRIIHPQKGAVWIEGQSSPELQDEGSILWYGFFHDATERKNAEAALAQSEETFRAMVENSPDVIIRYDLECRRTYVNPMAQLLMGKPLDEILGKTPSEYSPLPSSVEFEKLFARVVSEGKEIELESPYRTSEGEVRWGSQRIVPEFNAEGKVASIMVIGRDMTERKIMEKAL